MGGRGLYELDVDLAKLEDRVQDLEVSSRDLDLRLKRIEGPLGIRAGRT